VTAKNAPHRRAPIWLDAAAGAAPAAPRKPARTRAAQSGELDFYKRIQAKHHGNKSQGDHSSSLGTRIAKPYRRVAEVSTDHTVALSQEWRQKDRDCTARKQQQAKEPTTADRKNIGATDRKPHGENYTEQGKANATSHRDLTLAVSSQEKVRLEHGSLAEVSKLVVRASEDDPTHTGILPTRLSA